MKSINIRANTDDKGHLLLDIPTNCPKCKIEAVIIFNPVSPKKKVKEVYNFKDVAGKLKWKGSALKEQRKLRDEWQ